ncbi:exonuclease, DNA polymerase III, epsilon subunit family protein [delta proteobacterium NaphS2]|nr:exonuclease, DNA polymerase III, epsilon subunit family protein [delta proteobacterium NaphS2]
MPLRKLIKRFFPSRQQTHPAIVANNIISIAADKDLPVRDCEFVVFDTELTGLKQRRDEIIAIGAVRIKNARICFEDTFYALIKPQGKLYTPSTLIHRITPGELRGAEPIEEVLPRFIDFCGGAFLVGHHVSLDLGFVNRACQNYLGGVIKSPSLDTLRLARAYKTSLNGPHLDHQEQQDSYKLSSLSDEFHLPKFAEHNALQDALQTAYLFIYLIHKMRNGDTGTVNDYLKMK